MSSRIKRRPIRPQWVSHNKVLVGSGGGGPNKKPHARNPNFDSEETKLLISFWGDPLVQRTLITTHKKHPVIAKIADKMREYGYSRSTEEINTRIKNLKCLYNRIKKDIEVGVTSEATWKHFGAMDEILSRPVFGHANQQPALVRNDGQASNVKEEMEDLDDDNDMMWEDDDSTLRPEDLLAVEEEHQRIKDEPLDICDIQVIPSKPKSTVSAEQDDTVDGSPRYTLMKKSIINYANDSNLSITSVISKATAKPSGTATVLTTVPTNDQNASNANAANKISLVPTKLLLKPQQGITTTYKQPSLIYATKTSQGTSVSTSNSSIPMKVVFVNALNNRSSASQTITFSKSINTVSQMPQIMQQQIPATSTVSSILGNRLMGHEVQSTTPVVNAAASPTEPEVKKDPGTIKKPARLKIPVIRNLLQNLVSVQTQRLEVEKERLDYEKSIGGEILQLLREIAKPKETPKDSKDRNTSPVK